LRFKIIKTAVSVPIRRIIFAVRRPFCQPPGYFKTALAARLAVLGAEQSAARARLKTDLLIRQALVDTGLVAVTIFGAGFGYRITIPAADVTPSRLSRFGDVKTNPG
jgi:hypothetical protein